MAEENHGGRKPRRCTAPRQYSEIERHDGIVRLLAEAYCSLLRKQGRLKEFDDSKNPLEHNARYDFLSA